MSDIKKIGDIVRNKRSGNLGVVLERRQAGLLYEVARIDEKVNEHGDPCLVRGVGAIWSSENTEHVGPLYPDVRRYKKMAELILENKA